MFGISFFRFWINIPKPGRCIVAIAGIIFVFGSVGMEVISGSYFSSNNFTINYNYMVMGAIEEGLENLGSALFIYAMLLMLAQVKIVKKI